VARIGETKNARRFLEGKHPENVYVDDREGNGRITLSLILGR
jgi:hypothetical protein